MRRLPPSSQATCPTIHLCATSTRIAFTQISKRSLPAACGLLRTVIRSTPSCRSARMSWPETCAPGGRTATFSTLRNWARPVRFLPRHTSLAYSERRQKVSPGMAMQKRTDQKTMCPQMIKSCCNWVRIRTAKKRANKSTLTASARCSPTIETAR